MITFAIAHPYVSALLVLLMFVVALHYGVNGAIILMRGRETTEERPGVDDKLRAINGRMGGIVARIQRLERRVVELENDVIVEDDEP